MSNAPTDTAGASRLETAGIRRLMPETTTIFEGTFSLLHCAVKEVGLFRGVFAVRMFPIRQPERFISLRYTDASEKEQEIGIIESLDGFPKAQRDLVQRSLAWHYHEQIIRRIHRIRHEYGLLFFEVETQRGFEEFCMPWRGDRAEDYGERGKVLLSALDNRYIVPNVDDLPPADQRRLASYIYW